MAVPASGTIKFSGIYSELINDNYNQDLDQAAARPVSLKEMSDGTVSTIETASKLKPDGSAPHAMSEFYSYDHDA